MTCLYVGLIVSMFGAGGGVDFPPELVQFVGYEHNPIFVGDGAEHWDEMIRERGWIMREDGEYRLWYTGYEKAGEHVSKLGYATSPDGITWTRYAGNPIYTDVWIEDMTVVKRDGVYYMFAEGAKDLAQLLTSTDRVHWKREGTLDIRMVDGTPIAPGPFGTPAVLVEDGTWYLFYERDDLAVWLAKSKDLKVFTNVQDKPVIARGPDEYDQTMIAVNQVIKYKGRYYAYYHATGPKNGRDSWTMNVAVSEDLVHWQKYAGNPIIPENYSSGFLVDDGKQLRMYCMHPSVCLFYPK